MRTAPNVANEKRPGGAFSCVPSEADCCFDISTSTVNQMAVKKNTQPDPECPAVSTLLQSHSSMRSCACLLCIVSARRRCSHNAGLPAPDSQAGWAWHRPHHDTLCRFRISWLLLAHCRVQSLKVAMPNKVRCTIRPRWVLKFSLAV